MMIYSCILVCLVSSLLLSARPLQAVRGDDPEVVQYLNSLYDSVKNRTPRKVVGLNLLPDETMGFANIVRCFSDHHQVGQATNQDLQLPSNQRLLTFDLSSLSSFEALEYAELVYKVTNSYRLDMMTSESIQLNFYIEEGTNYTREFNLPSQSIACSDTEWRNLTVPNLHICDDRMLSVRVELLSGQDDALLDADLMQNTAIKLVVYTYDNVTAMGVGTDIDVQSEEDNESTQQQTVSKRSADTDEIPLTELAEETCRVQGRTLHYHSIFAPFLELIQPMSPWLNITFCYGRCDQPFGPEEHQKYSIHARIIASLNRHPDLAPPCCVASETTISEIIYRNLREDVVTMATLEHVADCGCR